MNKKNFNILKKIMLLLIILVVYIAIPSKVYALDEITISFETYGGTSVNDITKNANEEIGTLPTSTMNGYILDGWYKDDMYENKVSPKSKFNSDTTLYAKWESVYFPYIFKRDEINCTGSNYIDTNRKLYTQTNNDYLLDYEVGFTIDEYNPTGQTKQAVFFNAKWENTSKKWPGIVFRRMDATNNLEITQSINMGTKESHVIDNYTLPLEVKIYRIDHVIYYSLNGGEMIELQDMEDFNSYFDTNAFFCAGDNGSGGAQRYVKSKLSNVYIKMGSYEETTYNSVTYPDGTVELIEYNTFANVGTNNVDKADRDISLTFKQHNGEEDIVKTMHKSYTKNGFIVRGSEDVHYDDEGEIFVNEDKVIEYYYDEDIEEVEFPEDPEKDHYTFNGWFDSETGGEEITSYTGENDIEIHAQYTGEDVTIHTPTGDRTVHYGDNYNLGTNTITKANDNYSEVTFKLHNNHSDIIRHVEKVYTPNGWTISNTHYDDNESITITEEITIEPDYTESITGVEFPSDPVKEGYDFTGWYTEETGGDAISSYDGENDIEIHAQYEVHIPIITTPYGTYNPDENGNFTLETNSREKWPEVITSVYFVRNNGQRTYSEDLKYTYETNGWLIEGTHYDDGEVIHVTKDITVEPDYIKTLVLPPFPPTPVKEGYTFVGWFDANSGGNQYTTYDNVDGPRYFTLYARYRSNTSYGDYRLPRNETPKANTTRSTVTFVYHNGTADTTSTVETRYYPNGWLVDGVHHDDGDFIFKTDETVIEPDYNEYPVNGAFPTNPTKTGYQFVGWFTEETGGEPVTVLRGDSDLTVHAHYTDNYAITKERSSFGYTFTDAVYDNSIDQRDINILPGTVEQYNEAVAGGEAVIKNLESTTSPNPIYVWQSGENVYYYSPADVIFLPTNGSSIFYLVRFNTIDMSGFNTVKVTNMSQMFLYSYADLNISSFDTHNVTNMSDMFSYSNPHTSLDLRHFDTSKVRNMNSMFFGVYTSGEIDVSSFDTRNVTDLAGFFNTAFDYKTNITRVYNFNHFDTSKVTNLNATFNLCGLKHIDVDEWDTSNVTQMNSIFNNDNLFEELDLTNWDTHNVTTARSLFNTCYATTIYVSRDKWDMSQLQSDGTTNSPDYNMTNNMKNVVGQYGTKYNANNVKDKTYAVIDDAPETPGYLTDSYPDLYAVKVLDDLEIVPKKTQYTLPNNTEDSGVPDELLSTVTFKYFNGSEDTTSTVINTNMPSGWIIDGVHYDDGAQLTVTDDIEATPDFIEVVMGAEFPEDPTKTGYRFLGWYTEETGGQRITSYNDSEDITLYAHWELDLNPGEYELPVNDIDKDMETYTVTFIDDNTEYSISNVVVSYIPNGWLVDGEHYDVGETINYVDGMVIEPDYTKTVIGATFPENPTRTGQAFKGWYSAKTGGNRYTSYNEERNITLYSHYALGNGERYILPINDTPKATDILSTVTFKYHNGDPDTTVNVIREYIPNGWLVDGEHYNDEATIIKYPDTVIEPDYLEFIRNAEFPTDPTKDGYEFTGWFTEETGGDHITVLRGDSDLVVHAQYTDNYAYLIDGTSIRTLTSEIMENYNITYDFKLATSDQYQAARYSLTSTNIISTNDSPNVVYLWVDGSNVYYYSDADVIFLNEDSSNMFDGYEIGANHMFKTFTFDKMNTSKVTNMENMFGWLVQITELDLSGFDTHNVTNMQKMFYYDTKLENLNISSFDTSKVTNMSEMFSTDHSLETLDLSNFDTRNVTNMSKMFNYLGLEELDLSSFDTSNVTTMADMFWYSKNLKRLNLSNFDTSKVKNMSDMFQECSSLTELDLSTFDTSSVNNASKIFYKCEKLKTVYVSDKWDISSISDENRHNEIFRGCSKIVGQRGTTYTLSGLNKEYAIVDNAPEHPGYLTDKFPDLYVVTLPEDEEIVKDGEEFTIPTNNIDKAEEVVAVVTFKLKNGEEDVTSNVVKTYTPNGWIINGVHYDDGEIIRVTDDITLEPDYIEVIEGAEFPEDPSKAGYIFQGWYTEEINGELVTSYNEPEDITLYAHWELNPIEGEYELPVNDIDKENDTYTVTFIDDNTEYSTSNVVVTYVPNGWLVDGEHYDDGEIINYTDGMVIEPDYTKNITSAIFPDNPSRAGSNFSGWFDNKTGGNKYTSYNEEKNITLYSHFNVKEDAEEYILPINDIPKESEEVSTVTFKFHNGDPDYVSHVIKRYIPNGWLVDGVRYNANERIYKDENTVIEPNYNFYYVMDEYPANPTLDGYKFMGWYDEETGGELVTDYHGLEDKVLHAQYTNNYAILIPGPEVYDLFRQGVTIQGWSNWGSFFEKGTREGYESAQRGGYYDRFQFKISTDDSPNDVYIYATHENSGTQTYYYTDADVIFFNPDSSKFFSGFEGRYMNLSQFSTVDVENMASMFSYMKHTYLESLDLSNFDTRNVTNMSYMFNGANHIKNLDLSGFYTSKVTDMSYMLSLENVETLDLSSFDTSNVTNMSGIFSNLKKLKELNINNFDTSNVTDMSKMFYSAFVFTDLDLSVLNTSKVTDMSSMFWSTRYLKNIKLGNFDTSNVTNMSQMFTYLYAIEELDLSSFDTSNVTNANYMFSDSNKLKTVRVADGWTNENMTSSISMFLKTNSIVGQKGTTYDSSHTDKTYGIVDDAPDHPGYLTYKYKDLYTLTFPDYSDETEAGNYNLPLNTIEKQKEELKNITFKLHNGEEDIVKPIYIEYTPNGWLENDIHYDDTVLVERDMTFIPDYIEANTFEFPEDPTWNDIEFLGWYTEDGDKVESIDDIGDNTVLHAHWDTVLPTDLELDSDDIVMVVGETHQIEVTFIPDGSEDTLTYTGFDSEKISVTDGLITALEVGETTITIGTENTDIEKTISITIVSDKLQSDIYDVREADPDNNKDRIVIGAEPLTTISDYKDNMLNPNEYLKVYDSEGNELDDEEVIKTGQVIKLVYGSTVMDEAYIVIRGDVNKDGFVNMADYMIMQNHYLEMEEITEYVSYAAADVAEDEIINMQDTMKLLNYYTEQIDTLND